MVFTMLNLKNNELIEFLSENLLIALYTYQKVPNLSFIKRIVDNCKEE